MKSLFWTIVKSYTRKDEKVNFVIEDFTIYASIHQAKKQLKELHDQFFKDTEWKEGNLPYFEIEYGKTTVKYHLTSLTLE